MHCTASYVYGILVPASAIEAKHGGVGNFEEEHNDNISVIYPLGNEDEVVVALKKFVFSAEEDKPITAVNQSTTLMSTYERTFLRNLVKEFTDQTPSWFIIIS